MSRISRRVISQHHIALSDTLAGRDSSTHHDHVGIIYNNLSIKSTIEHCVELLRTRPYGVADEGDGRESRESQILRYEKEHWPEVVIDGHVDATLSYIKVSEI